MIDAHGALENATTTFAHKFMSSDIRAMKKEYSINHMVLSAECSRLVEALTDPIERLHTEADLLVQMALNRTNAGKAPTKAKAKRS